MIKVNLINDVSALANQKRKSQNLTFKIDLKTKLTSTAAGFAADETRGFILRMIVLIFPVLLTFSYDRYVKFVSEEDIKRLTAEYTALQEKLKIQEVAVKEVEKFQEEKRKLDSELQIIKNLSTERLKNVKALDALQGIIPIKAWLKDLKIVDKRLEMSGFAMDEFVISEFMQGLGSSIYFSNITLGASEEDKRKEGSVKKFIIKCKLENL